MRPLVDTAQQPRFDRGYTGHEHIASMGLINMNGRMYDPQLQRFLSADPVLQDPSNAQNFNKYSYCLNNPLMYTDPSGYKNDLWNSIKKGGNFVVNSTFSIPLAIADKAQDVAGENFVTNTMVNVTQEAYMGRADPTYYGQRLAGKSQIDASNSSISGGLSNFFTSFNYENRGQRRARSMNNVTAPASKYSKRPTYAEWCEQGNNYYNAPASPSNGQPKNKEIDSWGNNDWMIFGSVDDAERYVNANSDNPKEKFFYVTDKGQAIVGPWNDATNTGVSPRYADNFSNGYINLYGNKYKITSFVHTHPDWSSPEPSLRDKNVYTYFNNWNIATFIYFKQNYYLHTRVQGPVSYPY